MGVLKNVLNVLSPEVAGDTDNIPGDTASTQRSRRVRSVDDDEDRVAKKQFRIGVSNSLKMIGDGLRDANIIQAIVSVRRSIKEAEDTAMMLKVKCLTCSPEEKVLYEAAEDHHADRVKGYVEELAALVKKRDAVALMAEV
jgi:hypothetical protein